MNQIEFKKYTFWPNMKKMDKLHEEGGSTFEFLGFCFELSMTKEDKTTNAYFASYFLVDYHEGEKNISFGIPQIEEDSGNFFLYRIKEEKTSDKKTIAFENNNSGSKVNMKSQSVITNFDINYEYSKLIETFIEQDMKPHILKVKEFFHTHDISYDKNEVDEFVIEMITGATNFFNDKFKKDLKKSIADIFSQTSSAIMYEKMNNEFSQSPRKKALKI